MTVVLSMPEKIQGRKQAVLSIWIRTCVNGSMINFQKKPRAV